MKINDINRIQGINKYQQMNKQEQELRKKETKKDKLLISDEAKAMLEQTKQTNNPEKIKQLKEQVENGTYQVDSKIVAEKIIKNLLGE